MRVTTASAGTGKTTDIVARVLDLICSGIPLRRLAAVTFTRASAAELRSRIGEGLEEAIQEGRFLERTFDKAERDMLREAQLELGGAAIDTIHGFMGRVVRLVAPGLNVDPDIRMLEAWEGNRLFEMEARTLLRLLEAKNEDLPVSLRKAWQVLAAKNMTSDDVMELLEKLFEARQLAESLTSSGGEVNDAAQTVYEAAYKRFAHHVQASVTAPAEMERLAIQAVTDAGSLAERISSRVQVVLVDEFQDVNPTQATLFRLLEGAGVQVEVVGDPKQSIYLFRNADVQMFREAVSTGEMGNVLNRSFRHSRVVTQFLNLLSASMGERKRGFTTDEAPTVKAMREEHGRLDLVITKGPFGVAELRRQEARALADRLRDAHDRGIAWRDMAVLYRGSTSLPALMEGLEAQGVPFIMAKGRDYFQRQEVVDLVTALRVATRPTPTDWMVFLRTAFAGVPVSMLGEALASDDVELFVAENLPDVFERVENIRRIAGGSPRSVLAELAYARILPEGVSFMETLSIPARDNVTHLVRLLARSAPVSVSHLIDELDRLSNQTEASDMPQEADAVTLSTIHSSKGLEWKVVGVFNLGAGKGSPPKPVVVDGGSGRFALRGTNGYNELLTAHKKREDMEEYRLLYVAVSRPRDELILTGSVSSTSRSRTTPVFLEALEDAGFGPDDNPMLRAARAAKKAGKDPDAATATIREKGFDFHEVLLEEALPARKKNEDLAPTSEPVSGLASAPWSTTAYPAHDAPPVNSPTRHLERLREEQARANGEVVEPTMEPAAVALDEDELPDRGRIIGTLVHYGISQDWDPAQESTRALLEAQSLLQPLVGTEEYETTVEEILSLLTAYRRMLASGKLEPLASRTPDLRELPVQLKHGGVWTGVIDRLYKLPNGAWMMDDYKTDGTIVPDRYYFQLGLYAQAAEQILGVRPAVRLVYLRTGEVVPVSWTDLEQALADSLPEPAEAAA